MSYTSGFFDAVDLGGGNYDRAYKAAVFAHYFSLLVKNGVFPDPSTGMQVKASSSPDMNVSIQPGSGWINGYYITIPEDAPEVLPVPTANPSLSRIDSVIMGLNLVSREIQLYIKSGAVSASPSAVSLQRDSDVYEMELAQIAVAAGVTSVPQSSITDMRQNTSRCGIVKGTIDQIDTTDLFAQYNDAFQTWFSNLQIQLDGNVAANLQSRITALESNKVNVSDKASMAQAQAGTDDTKWMTPAKVKSWWDNFYKGLILSVAKGGTGKSSWSANRLIYPSAATTLAQLAFPSKSGAILKQNTSGAPYWGYPSEAGTYIGQGRTGAKSPNTITFVNGAPKVVFIKQQAQTVAGVGVRWGLLLITSAFSTGFSLVDGVASELVVSISGNTVSWYYDSTEPREANQLDHNTRTFAYVGIF